MQSSHRAPLFTARSFSPASKDSHSKLLHVSNSGCKQLQGEAGARKVSAIGAMWRALEFTAVLSISTNRCSRARGGQKRAKKATSTQGTR
jgi:hypothetical protein